MKVLIIQLANSIKINNQEDLLLTTLSRLLIQRFDSQHDSSSLIQVLQFNSDTPHALCSHARILSTLGLSLRITHTIFYSKSHTLHTLSHHTRLNILAFKSNHALLSFRKIILTILQSHTISIKINLLCKNLFPTLKSTLHFQSNISINEGLNNYDQKYMDLSCRGVQRQGRTYIIYKFLFIYQKKYVRLHRVLVRHVFVLFDNLVRDSLIFKNIQIHMCVLYVCTQYFRIWPFGIRNQGSLAQRND